MDKIYSSLNLKSFKRIATLVFLAADLGLVVTIYRKFTNPSLYDEIFQVLKTINPQMQGNFTNQMRVELFQLYENSLVTLLVLVVLYHLFVSFLWNRGTFVARGYISLYCWTAGPILTLSGLLSLTTPLSAIVYLLLGAMYLYVALGMKVFPEENPKNKKRNSRPQKKSGR